MTPGRPKRTGNGNRLRTLSPSGARRGNGTVVRVGRGRLGLGLLGGAGRGRFRGAVGTSRAFLTSGFRRERPKSGNPNNPPNVIVMSMSKPRRAFCATRDAAAAVPATTLPGGTALPARGALLGLLSPCLATHPPQFSHVSFRRRGAFDHSFRRSLPSGACRSSFLRDFLFRSSLFGDATTRRRAREQLLNGHSLRSRAHKPTGWDEYTAFEWHLFTS